MEIIQTGSIDNLQENRRWKFNCHWCKCIFVCRESEIERSESDFRNGTVFSHTCPTCGKTAHSGDDFIGARIMG